MSFGKRGPSMPPQRIKKSPITAEDDVVESQPSASSGGFNMSWTLRQQLKQIAGTSAIILAGFFLVPKLLFSLPGSAMGSSSDQWANAKHHRIPRIAMTRPDGQPGISSMDEDLNEFCIPKSSQGPRHQLVRLNAESVRASWTSDGRLRLGVKQATQFLTCTMRVNRKRFCKPFYQKRLVNRFKVYLMARNNILEDKRRSGEARSRPHFLHNSDRIQAGTNKDVPLNQDLADAISDLSADGYLRAANFGWFGSGIPKEIAPLLTDEPARKHCS